MIQERPDITVEPSRNCEQGRPYFQAVPGISQAAAAILSKLSSEWLVNGAIIPLQVSGRIFRAFWMVPASQLFESSKRSHGDISTRIIKSWKVKSSRWLLLETCRVKVTRIISIVSPGACNRAVSENVTEWARPAAVVLWCCSITFKNESFRYIVFVSIRYHH